MGSRPLIPRPESAQANLFQAILDNATESIVLIGKDHKVLVLNSVIREVLTSYFEKELEVGDDYRDFVIEENMQLYLESFEKAINGASIAVENETPHAQGSIWFRYTVNPVYDKAQKLIGVTLTATDIDAKKRLEIEREKIIHDLTRRNDELIKFSQIVSHNLRAPVATLLGLADLVTHDLTEADKYFMVEGIKKTTVHIDQVINDLNQVLEERERGTGKEN